MDAAQDPNEAPSQASPTTIHHKQADFDALLLEAVIKKQHQVVKATVLAGANVNHVGVAKKKTPLMIAIKQNDMEMVDLLIQLKAKLETFVGTHHKISAIHLAVSKNNFVMVQHLLDAGCNPNLSSPDIKGLWTPLHEAALHSSNEILELLLDRGADIEAKTLTQATPLALAARHYKVAATRFLLSRGANVNTQDKSGSTPLMQACLVGATAVAKLLLEVGKADLTIKNKAGATALDEADRKDMWECALYIWSVGGESGAFKTTKGLGPVKWTRPRVVGSAPSPRYSCGATQLGSSLYIFGGVGFPDGHIYNPDQSIHDDDNYEDHPSPTQHTSFHRLDLDKIYHRSIIPSDTKKAPTNITMDRIYIGKEIDISEDGLTVTSIDPDLEDAEPSCARAAIPFTKADGFAYFEVTVLNEGVRGVVAVGLVGENYPMDKMPGWQVESIGYHADDACAFHNTGWGRQWGKRYGTGDVVGCGLVFNTGEVFYTLNGEFLGVAYRTFHECYYASVGFRNSKTQLKLNFGALPFYFDFRVPTIQWERLPTSAAEFQGHSPFHLFSVHNGLVLLGNGPLTATQGYWVWKDSKWYRCTATGEKPLIYESFNYTVLDDSIYAIVHKSAKSLDGYYKLRPVIFRLQLSPSLMEAKWIQLFPKPSFTVAQEYIDNWFSAGQTILKEFAESNMVGVDDRLCFIGSTSLALMNPESFEIEVKPYVGAIPPVDKFSTAVVGYEIETFGGWDQHSQRNEVNILDTRCAVWYQPHVLGISPRPRNHHSAAVVKVTNPKSLRSTHVEVVAVDPMRSLSTSTVSATSPNSQLQQQEEDHSSTLIVHAFGWNGCNYIDDVEILSLQNKEPADPLITLLVPFERQEPGIVNFRFTDFDGSVKFLSSSAIVVAARATGFRKLIEAGETTIAISRQPWHLFLSFITFLHDDLADFSVDRESARMFCKIVDTWAPEHSKRIVEALVLTRLYNRSRMSEDLTWAFQNPLYADVSFKIGDQKILAHKCILTARSQYFHSLLTGGLAESQTNEIILSDVSYESFRLILNYLYTQSFDLENVGDNITDVFMLACKYSLSALRQQIEAIISYNISIENAASLFLLAEVHNSNTLIKTCTKFIANHFDEISQTEDYSHDAGLIYTHVQPYLEKIQAKAESALHTSSTAPETKQ